jgi:GT2 family glycosyltransferase
MVNSYSKPGISGVSAIVVNYNSGKYLNRCIQSVISQVDEIIVVDNSSQDDSLKLMLDEFSNSPKIKLIRNTNNLGFATACNQGANQCVGDFIFFLNPDCIAFPDSIAQLQSELVNKSVAGMVGGLLLDPNGREQAGGRRLVPTPWRSFVRAFHLEDYEYRWPRLFQNFNLNQQPLPISSVSLEAISGACTMVKREAMIEVGPWDEGYFLHCEDLDLCMRYRQKEWSILFVPSAKFTHFRGACSRSRPLFVEWHKHKGMMRFYLKFFRHQYPGALMLLVALGVWLRFCAIACKITLQRLLPLRAKVEQF